MVIFDLELYGKIHKSTCREYMTLKKISIGAFILLMLNGCAQNAALLGPAYTMVTTGNAYQAGFTYGSDRAVRNLTGKTTGENIKAIFKKKEDNEFEMLVKRQIKETRRKLKFSN